MGTLSSGEDVTERRAAEQQITYLAYHDPLTGLANQALLAEHLKLALARSRRTGAGVALLHLGLDGFKLVNDSLGHARGDELLCRLAVRLRESVRATDLLARAGGDEFLLLLADLARRRAAGVAERVAAQVARLPRRAVRGRGRRVPDLRLHRDRARARATRATPRRCSRTPTRRMHQAKETRARRLGGLRRRPARDPLERLSMAARLRRALADEEFQLHYQPIFAADGRARRASRRCCAGTTRSAAGSSPPAEFIPVAEDTGLIESIGDWVIGAVCAQQVAWAGRGHRAADLLQRLAPPAAPARLHPRASREHLARTGADPARITVELTETAMHQDSGDAEPVLRALHELGLQLALDDFGSGYSSLVAPARDAGADAQDRPRVPARRCPRAARPPRSSTAILALARALGRSTVAEGVETEAQRDFLLEQECPLLQGFLLARPMPVDEVEALMAAEPAAA